MLIVERGRENRKNMIGKTHVIRMHVTCRSKHHSGNSDWKQDDKIIHFDLMDVFCRFHLHFRLANIQRLTDVSNPY